MIEHTASCGCVFDETWGPLEHCAIQVRLYGAMRRVGERAIGAETIEWAHYEQHLAGKVAEIVRAEQAERIADLEQLIDKATHILGKGRELNAMYGAGWEAYRLLTDTRIVRAEQAVPVTEAEAWEALKESWGSRPPAESFGDFSVGWMRCYRWLAPRLGGGGGGLVPDKDSELAQQRAEYRTYSEGFDDGVRWREQAASGAEGVRDGDRDSQRRGSGAVPARNHEGELSPLTDTAERDAAFVKFSRRYSLEHNADRPNNMSNSLILRLERGGMAYDAWCAAWEARGQADQRDTEPAEPERGSLAWWAKQLHASEEALRDMKGGWIMQSTNGRYSLRLGWDEDSKQLVVRSAERRDD